MKTSPRFSKESFNVASYLPRMARIAPCKRAVVFPHGRDSEGRVTYAQLTFLQLDMESSRYAHGLYKIGVRRGQRVLVMVRPGIEFVGLAFALFKMGAVPVLIDPGMGVSNLLNCIKQVEPEAMVAVPTVHMAKLLKPEYFSSIKYCVTVGRRFFWNGTTLRALLEEGSADFLPVETKEYDPAAILFTTGSTGVPKGVVYLHGMFAAQVEHVKSQYGICEEDVDMPAFPLFALFSTAIGMTCVIPDMDPSKPAKVDPKKIVEAIRNQGVTTSFGSPAIWSRVGEYCAEKKIRLPSIKRILMAGAPVPVAVLERYKDILSPAADTHTPYGATEALPVASISGSERMEIEEKTESGKGICVGRALPGITIKIIKISDKPIPAWHDSLLSGSGERGEIVCKGDVVTREYFRMERETEMAKIADGDTIWHRMGDIGYLDGEGRLWFCGRKVHRVITKEKTLFSVPCESIFNRHPDVFRSALVGVGDDIRPVIIIEPLKGKMPRLPTSKKRFVKELLKLGGKHGHTKGIKDFLFHPSFPVDIRHNVKIFREKLALWAETKLRS